MSVANFLDTAYYHEFLYDIYDTQDILDELATYLPACGWTANGSDSYTSPVDSDGRFMTIEFTRVDANYLQMDVLDQNDFTVSQRRMYISSTDPSRVSIFVGPFHFCLDAARLGSTTGEWLAAGMLDNSPEDQSASDRYVYGQGSRNSSGTFSYNTWDYASMLDNNTATHDDRINKKDNGRDGFYKTLGGQWLYHPVEFFVDTATVVFAFAGRAYQQILVSEELCLRQSLIRLPIDSSSLGSFRGVTGAGIVRSYRLAIRV